MESSRLKRDRLYDPIRRKWVDNTPEENIRQRLIRLMIEELGYHPSLIAIEKELSTLPHLKNLSKTLPKRRADILVFANNTADGFSPLLIVECKAIPLCPKFARQVIGYNAFVGAPFVSLANADEVLTGFYDPVKESYQFEKGLFHYARVQKTGVTQAN